MVISEERIALLLKLAILVPFGLVFIFYLIQACSDTGIKDIINGLCVYFGFTELHCKCLNNCLPKYSDLK